MTEEEKTVPYTKGDREMLSKVYENSIQMETLIKEMVKPRLELVEKRVVETRKRHDQDIATLGKDVDDHDQRLSQVEGGISTGKWIIATLVAALGLLIAAMSAVLSKVNIP